MTSRAIERAILKLLEERHPGTACPSEIARALDAEAWRALMPKVREAAGRLAQRARLDVLQKGQKVELGTTRGPIRLRLATVRERPLPALSKRKDRVRTR